MGVSASSKEKKNKNIKNNPIVDTGECIFNGNQLEETLRNEFNRTLQVPVEYFNYDTKSIIGMSGEGRNTNPEMYIGKKRGEELVCVIKDLHRVHILEHRH